MATLKVTEYGHGGTVVATREVEISPALEQAIRAFRKAAAATPWCRCPDADDPDRATTYFEGGPDAKRFGWSHGWKCATCNGLVQGG